MMKYMHARFVVILFVIFCLMLSSCGDSNVADGETVLAGTDSDHTVNDQIHNDNEQVDAPSVDNTKDSSNIDQSGADSDIDVPVELRYVLAGGGRYVYRESASQSVGIGNNNAFIFKPSQEITFLHALPSTHFEVESDVLASQTFSVFGKDVLLRYQRSILTGDTIDTVVKKYNDVRVYKDDNGGTYHISSQTNQLIEYYTYNTPVKGNLTNEDARIMAQDLISSQLGDDIADMYDIKELSYGPALDGCYRFLFVRKIHGFDTTDRIQVSISSSGEIQSYMSGQIQEFEIFEKMFSHEDIIWTIDELKMSLYNSGIYMSGQSQYTLVTDGCGVLFVMVEYASGHVFYLEVESADAY